jgi:hypothetical protein
MIGTSLPRSVGGSKSDAYTELIFICLRHLSTRRGRGDGGNRLLRRVICLYGRELRSGRSWTGFNGIRRY